MSVSQMERSNRQLDILVCALGERFRLKIETVVTSM